MSMTSLDFLNNIINPARVAAGEGIIRNTNFLVKVEDELDDLSVAQFQQPLSGGTPQKYYNLTEDQMRLVGMRESKAVRRAVLAELNRLYAKAEEQPLSIKDLLVAALADIEAKEVVIADKTQRIRDRALRGVLCTPKKLVAEYCVRAKCKPVGGTVVCFW